MRTRRLVPCSAHQLMTAQVGQTAWCPLSAFPHHCTSSCKSAKWLIEHILPVVGRCWRAACTLEPLLDTTGAADTFTVIPLLLYHQRSAYIILAPTVNRHQAQLVNTPFHKKRTHGPATFPCYCSQAAALHSAPGIPHILEHSVLCGSRKYPIKEPFVELMKGSLNTFLNAFTYPDRTCYPVASTNTQVRITTGV